MTRRHRRSRMVIVVDQRRVAEHMSATARMLRDAAESWAIRLAAEQAEEFPDLAPRRVRRTLRQSDERQT